MAGARRPVQRPNPRPQNSMGGMPGRGGPATGPHMEFGQRGQDTGHGGLGGPQVDPGFNRQDPRDPLGGQPPNRGTDSWMNKHPNGPLAQAGQRPGGAPNLGMPNMPNYGGFDTRAAQTAAAQGYYGAESNINRVKASTISDWLGSQGLDQGQPVGIGGMRFYDQGGDLSTTGQRSDVAFGGQPLGAAYDSGEQSYFPGYGKIKRRGGTTGGYIQ